VACPNWLCVAPRAPVIQDFARHLRQFQRLIESPIRQQACVVGELGAVKFQFQPAVESDPQSTFVVFTL